MQAAALFDLRIVHPFYTDRRCGDLAISPSARTEALMRRLNLTYKIFPDHVSVYAGLAGNGTTIAAAAAPVTLDFLLRSNGNEFALITDVTALTAQMAPVYTNNGVAAGEPLNLRLTTRTARAIEVLVSVTPSAEERFVLAGAPLTADFAVSGAGSAAVPSPDLRLITIDTSGIAEHTTFQISYPVRPPWQPGALAEVALELDAALLTPAATPRGFQVLFEVLARYWAYYVVMDFAGDVAALRIIDATPGNGPRAVVFSDAGRSDLSLAPDAADTVGLTLLRGNPGRRVIRFLSDAQVVPRELPVSHLELHLADTRLAAALGNPSPGRSVSLRNAPAPAAPVIANYHVLTLLSN